MAALVLEDDPLTGAVLAETLRQNGWDARWSSNLADARAQVRAFDPDLLLVDVRVGRDDGLDLLREAGATRRAVVLTAVAGPELEAIRREFPAAEVVSKPASPEELIRVIGRGRKGKT